MRADSDTAMDPCCRGGRFVLEQGGRRMSAGTSSHVWLCRSPAAGEPPGCALQVLHSNVSLPSLPPSATPAPSSSSPPGLRGWQPIRAARGPSWAPQAEQTVRGFPAQRLLCPHPSSCPGSDRNRVWHAQAGGQLPHLAQAALNHYQHLPAHFLQLFYFLSPAAAEGWSHGQPGQRGNGPLVLPELGYKL